MAHAINYPRIPRDVVPATGKTRPNVSTRLLRSIQKAQMARARREIALYAPHIAAQMEIGVYRELDPAEGESLRVNTSVSEWDEMQPASTQPKKPMRVV